MRILQIAAPAVAGGLERVVQGLAIGLHRRGHDVVVAAVLPGKQPSPSFVDPLRQAGVLVYEIPVPARGYRQERRAIRDLCKQARPDVVHTHGYRTDLVDRPVAAALGIPTVTTVHGPSMFRGLKNAIYEWMQRRNYRRFDAVVAVSKGLFDLTLADGVRPERLYRIPNAWAGLYEPFSRAEARRELELSEEGPVVGWVGRLIPVKACDVFLDAMHRLPEPRPTIVVIGQGVEGDRLRAQAERLGLTSALRFYSDITDAGRLFRAFDVYVLSSRSEGMPIVVLEAIAAGTPIVATRVGGVPELLGEDCAWLVPPDDPTSLATAIEASFRDRVLAGRRAEHAARALAEEFGANRWLVRHEAVYRRAAGLPVGETSSSEDTGTRSTT